MCLLRRCSIACAHVHTNIVVCGIGTTDSLFIVHLNRRLCGGYRVPNKGVSAFRLQHEPAILQVIAEVTRLADTAHSRPLLTAHFIQHAPLRRVATSPPQHLDMEKTAQARRTRCTRRTLRMKLRPDTTPRHPQAAGVLCPQHNTKSLLLHNTNEQQHRRARPAMPINNTTSRLNNNNSHATRNDHTGWFIVHSFATPSADIFHKL